MYKTKLLFVLLLIYNLSNAQKNISLVEYAISSEIKIDNSNSKKKSQYSDIITSALNKTKSVTLQLFFNENESFFQKQKKIELDNSKISSKISNIISGVKGAYYKNIKEKQILLQKESLSQLFIIDYSEEKQNWKLTKDSKKIGKYLCYKATLNEKNLSSSGKYLETEIIAWYTPEIAVPFGPLAYGDLPGLILELNRKKMTYYVKKINLKHNDNKEQIKKPLKGKRMTKSEYDSFLLKTMNDRG